MNLIEAMDRYVEIKIMQKSLGDEAKELQPTIINGMHQKTTVHSGMKFTRCCKQRYQYSDRVETLRANLKDLQDELKEMERNEQKEGVAVLIEPTDADFYLQVK